MRTVNPGCGCCWNCRVLSQHAQLEIWRYHRSRGIPFRSAFPSLLPLKRRETSRRSPLFGSTTPSLFGAFTTFSHL
ncbi:hypothetical protein TNCV_2742071 [Trichonephila clavipes]|nr:hypothetical protein TNCV_2742071 [Trichonephila clavipes]